jgi:thiamine-phosphate pyrophosphorylase
MPARCLLYYITDRTAFPGDETARRRRLLEKVAEAARAGIDYIQLREKDLPARELESLAREALRAVRDAGKLATAKRQPETALLINSRTDIALAVGADGVHLRSDDILPQQARRIWESAETFAALRTPRSVGQLPRLPIIGVSCHSPAEVGQAAANGGTFAVFAPVFEKKDAPNARPTGLELLKQACRTNIPVFALGGVTLDNAKACLAAGAAGLAAIRLFQENDVGVVVRGLRS